MRLPRTPARSYRLRSGDRDGFALAPTSAAAPDPAPRPLHPDTGRYVVVLKPSVDRSGAVAAEHSRRFGAQVSKVYGSAAAGLRRDDPGRPAGVGPVGLPRPVRGAGHEVQASTRPGTGVRRVQAADKANNGAGVDVAVIDTGIDLDHPDLAANIVGGTTAPRAAGALRRRQRPRHPRGGHDRARRQRRRRRRRRAGADLWAVRVLDNGGSGSTSDVICGIDFVDSKSPAKGGPITVANMSLGGWGADDGSCGALNNDAMHAAICRAVADGVTFVVAAGNATADVSQMRPSAYNEVITVTALGDSDGQPCGQRPGDRSYAADDTFASFSNFASFADDQGHVIGAPGVGIYSTYKGGGYATLNGTSMASPHVAGAAALYLAAHPEPRRPLSTPLCGRRRSRRTSASTGSAPSTSSGGKRGATSVSGVSHRDTSGRHAEPVLRADTL